jgi:GntR family transcriptional regulator
VKDPARGDGHVDEAHGVPAVVAGYEDIPAWRQIEIELLVLADVLPRGDGGRELELVGPVAIRLPGLPAAQRHHRSGGIGQSDVDSFAGGDVSGYRAGVRRQRGGLAGAAAGRWPAAGQGARPGEATAGGRRDDKHHHQPGLAAPPPGTGACFCYQCLRLGRCPRAGRGCWRRGPHGASLTGTMLGVKVDRADRLPLHDQVCAEIRRAIADGEVRPGERLPPARDLAAVLKVNSNTVLRALRLLRDEGLLEFRRGRGITVVGPAHRGAVLARARELVQFARGSGYGRDELIKIIEDIA